MRQPIPFGKYLLLERISVGGMAEVFKAKSFGVEGFEKIIAIKRILPTMVEDADFIQMFIDEAKIAGQLSHANICQIFELGKIAESHFIAMEFVWGKDLLQIQNRFRKLRQPVPVSMAAFIAAKMCEGLDYAHKKKDARGNPLFIVHRDVSPQNILVSYEGEIKLIDFGIAKATTRSSKTQAGVLKGKFGYMSPEQVRGLPLDRRSDLFALGTILYEMLTAERLFLGESDFSTLERVRNVDIQPPSRHNRNVPPALEKIVMKALAKEPEDRYQWANELQDELLQFVMAQPQVFTAKQLAAWMKEAFSPELARERQLLEQYKRLGRDGQVGPPSSPVVSIAPPPMPARSELTGPTATDTRESEEPSFEDLLEDSLSASVSLDVPLPGASPSAPTVRPGSTGAAAVAAASAGRAAPVASGTGAASAFVSASASSGHGRVSKGGSAGFGDEGPTEIFGEVESRSPTAGPKVGPESTVILPGTGTPPPPAPAPVVAAAPPSLTAVPSALGLARAPSSAGGGPAPAPLGLAFASPPSLSQLAPAGGFPAATPLGTAPPGVSAIDRGATADVPRLQPAAPSRRRQLLRDVAVAAGVAVLVLGLIVGGKLLFFGLRRPAPVVAPAVTTGTIVVAAADNGVGDVYVNGQKRGELYAGADPLQIEGLPGGDYDITVKRAGVPDYVQRVRLDVHRPEVVFCRFEQPAPQHGKLVLHIKTEGVTVLVDNQEISADAAREPLLLAPRVEHVITFQREGYLPESLQLALADGEVQEREIELEPAEAAKPKKKKPVEAPADNDAAPVAAVAPPPPPADTPAAETDVGFLIANTTPYARVLIDAKDTGKMTPIAPRAKIPLKPGKHTVTFVVGEESFPYPIMIEAGKDHRLIKTLPVE